MSENTERLDAIQRRIDAATPGAVTITPSDVAFLLDLARKQQAALDAVEALHIMEYIEDGEHSRNRCDECLYEQEAYEPCPTIAALEANP